MVTADRQKVIAFLNYLSAIGHKSLRTIIGMLNISPDNWQVDNRSILILTHTSSPSVLLQTHSLIPTAAVKVKLITAQSIQGVCV